MRMLSREVPNLATYDQSWGLVLDHFMKEFPLDGTEGSEYAAFEAAFPGRERGARRDHNSFFPLEQDLTHLVLPHCAIRSSNPLCRVRDGVLEDLFHPAEQPVGPAYGLVVGRTAVWKARPFPLLCEVCAFVCDGQHNRNSYDLFINHCTTYSHKQKMLPESRRVDDLNMIDPRHLDNWTSLPAMNKFMSVWCYRKAMLAFFRAPMDEASWENMAVNLDWIRESVLGKGACSVFVPNIMLISPNVVTLSPTAPPTT
jgi:hypothetical protein